MDKGRLTRERIIEQAAALFNQRGFEGASMAELMQATGLEKGGIYRHFSSKEDLAAKAFDYAWQTVFDLRNADLETVPNRLERIKKFAHNFVTRTPAFPGGCPLLNTAVDADDGNLILRARVRKAFYQLRNQLVEITREGMREGHIREGTDPKRLATMIISLLEGAVMISRLERNREVMQIAQEHLDDYLEGLRP